MADLQNINDIIKNNKFVVISSGDERTDKGYPIRIFNFKDNSSKNEYVFKIISNTSNGTIKLDFELNSLNKIRGIPTSTNSPIKNIEVNNIKKLIKLAINCNIIDRKTGLGCILAAASIYTDSKYLEPKPIPYFLWEQNTNLKENIMQILNNAKNEGKKLAHCLVACEVNKSTDKSTKIHAITMSFDIEKCLEKLGKDPIEKLEPLKDFLISDSSGAFFKYVDGSDYIKGGLKESFNMIFSQVVPENVNMFKNYSIQVGGKCAEFAKYTYQVLSSLNEKSFDNLEKIIKINHLITCEVASRVEANYAQAMGKNEKDVDVRRVSNSEKPDKGYFKVNFPEYNSSYIFRRNEVNREATKDCLTVCVSNFKGNKELKELIKKVKDGHCSGTMVLDYSPDISLIMLKEDDRIFKRIKRSH